MKYIYDVLKKIQSSIKKEDNAIEIEIISLPTSKKIYKNIKESVADLIKENEKYFISEITRSSIDAIVQKKCHLQKLKTMGFVYTVSAETFEKYGIFLYVTDLSTYIYAPKQVKIELSRLIEEYGVEKITDEIAIYLKNNHSDKFGINIVARP